MGCDKNSHISQNWVWQEAALVHAIIYLIYDFALGNNIDGQN